MKKIYLVVMALLLGMLTGCANLADVKNATIGTMEYGQALTKDDTGIIYGVAITIGGSGADAVKSACDANKNIDARCAHQDDYILSSVVPVSTAFSGQAQVVTLIPKNANVKTCRVMGYAGCTFVKIKAKKGEIASFIEVASIADDKRCDWHGAPTIGGTVCPAYSWDNNQSIRGFSAFLGSLTGVDN